MKAANEILRFLLELLALLAFAISAGQLAGGPARFALAALAVAAAGGYWGVLVAPKSARRLKDPARLIAESVFFVAAGLALGRTVSVWMGAGLTVVGIANAVLLRMHDPVLGALE
jgi:hypothetical protein